MIGFRNEESLVEEWGGVERREEKNTKREKGRLQLEVGDQKLGHVRTGVLARS